VSNALSVPTLELHDGNGGLIATNNNWKSDKQTQIEATQIAPPSPPSSPTSRSAFKAR